MGKPYSHKKDIYTGRVCPKVLNKYAMYQQETGNRNIKAEYIYIYNQLDTEVVKLG